jgi:hypothetical protein
MLSDIFSVTAVLGGRGIKLHKTAHLDNTMVIKENRDSAFEYITNNGTNDLVKQENIFSSKNTSGEQLQQLQALTLEWFVAELLVRKFYFHSANFGVEIVDGFKPVDNCDQPMGDFDVVGISRNLEPVFVECKSGNPCNVESKHFFNNALRGLAVQSPFTVMVFEQTISVETLNDKLNSRHWPNGSKLIA